MNASVLTVALGIAAALVVALAMGLVLGGALVWGLLRTRIAAPRARAPRPPDTVAAAPAAKAKDPVEQRTIRRLRRALERQTAREADLIARAAQVHRRDRAELIALQNEIEEEARAGAERARLLRGTLRDLWEQSARLRRAEARAGRLELTVAAAMASMAHSKRAQARATSRLARSRERPVGPDGRGQHARGPGSTPSGHPLPDQHGAPGHGVSGRPGRV